MDKIKRAKLAHFLNTATTAEPTWSRMNKGITELTTSFNPEVTTEKSVMTTHQIVSILTRRTRRSV